MSLRHPDSAELVHAPPNHPGAILWQFAFSPDLRRVAYCGDSVLGLKVWQLLPECALVTSVDHQSSLVCVAWSPDGRAVVCGGWDGSLRCYDAASWDLAWTLPGLPGNVWGVVFAQQAPLLVAAGAPGWIEVYAPAEAGWSSVTPVRSIAARGSDCLCAALSPAQPHLLAVGQRNGSVLLADIQQGAVLAELSLPPPSSSGPRQPQNRAIRRVQFSLDGLRLLTASYDATATVFDVATQQPIAALVLRHPSYVNDACFSADNLRIYTASGTHVRIWSAQTGEMLREVYCGSASAVLAPQSAPWDRVAALRERCMKQLAAPGLHHPGLLRLPEHLRDEARARVGAL